MNIYIPGTGFATQGPCPDGFHVPLQSEWSGLYTIMSGLSLTTGNNWVTNLHLPFAGRRQYNGTQYAGRGTFGNYLSSSYKGSGSAYVLSFDSSINYNASMVTSYGLSIRPFKNSFVAPTSGWTVITGTLGGARIFWNQTDGIISITSNGSTGYTIADKNLGATVVYNDGDTLSESNCGYNYQRGNNYGFPFNASVTKSSTQVNASNYGPGNYYSSSTFISGGNNWDSSNNGNLRGGVDGNVPIMKEVQNIYIGEYVPNLATQGPCPDGFHVPTKDEWVALVDAGVTNGAWTSSGGINLSTYLKLPFNGRRNCGDSGNVQFQGTYGFYWSSIYSLNSARAYILNLETGAIYANSDNPIANGCGIRPFKDTPVAPDSGWTALYSDKIYHNNTLGLISIKNGTDWITIADKNLGATTVYNNGDTLSESNCGKYYQWGNNYGFSWTGSITTSTTQVNAQNYGPGNYYSSSTFIAIEGNWSSVTNANLRGGEDGNVPV